MERLGKNGKNFIYEMWTDGNKKEPFEAETFFLVPLIGQNQEVLGVLEASNNLKGKFSHEETLLLKIISVFLQSRLDTLEKMAVAEKQMGKVDQIEQLWSELPFLSSGALLQERLRFLEGWGQSLFGVSQFRIVLVEEEGNGGFLVKFTTDDSKLIECSEHSSITVQTAKKKASRISLDTANEVDFNPKIDLRCERPVLFYPAFAQDLNCSSSSKNSKKNEQNKKNEQSSKEENESKGKDVKRKKTGETREVVAVFQLELKGAQANFVDIPKKDYDELHRRYTKISIDINVVMKTLAKAVNYLVRS